MREIRELGKASEQSTFSFAFLLLHSKKQEEREKGMNFLVGITVFIKSVHFCRVAEQLAKQPRLFACVGSCLL